jgi:hypothetical protein
MSSISIDSNTGMPYNYNYLSDVGLNPIVIGIIVIVIIVYFLLFSSLGSSSSVVTDNTSSGTYGYIEMFLWAIFILLILLNGMSYFFNINIIASIKNIFSSSPNVDIIVDTTDVEGKLPSPVPEIGLTKQVFHISDNKYNYEDAKAICQAYGGRLATYNEIEDAYKKGGDWCSYGWSDGQYAYYPTQQEKWEKLQKIPGHEHDCGRVSVNGGFFSNPDMKFGVNCYGYKPKITPDEAQTMINTPLYPKTNKEIVFEEKVDYWRSKLNELTVAPFNHNNWSMV